MLKYACDACGKEAPVAPTPPPTWTQISVTAQVPVPEPFAPPVTSHPMYACELHDGSKVWEVIADSLKGLPDAPPKVES